MLTFGAEVGSGERKQRREGIGIELHWKGLCSALGSPKLPTAYPKVGSDFRLWPSLRGERPPSQRRMRPMCCPVSHLCGQRSLATLQGSGFPRT